MATRAELVDELLKLPKVDRAEAASALLESLDGAEDPTEVAAAWDTEIARRVAEIDGDDVELEDGPTAMKALRERAQARLDQNKR